MVCPGSLVQNSVGTSDQVGVKEWQPEVKNCAVTRQEVTGHSDAVMVSVPPFFSFSESHHFSVCWPKKSQRLVTSLSLFSRSGYIL